MKIPSKLSQDDIRVLYGQDVPPPPATVSEVADPGQDDTWAPPLTKTQQEIFDSTARYILAEGERFSGKCRSPDAQIYEADGLRRLGRIVDSFPGGSGLTSASVKVITLTEDGTGLTPSTAMGVWRETSKSALKAVLGHGGELIGSPKHPVWVSWVEDGDEPYFGWKTLEEIKLRMNFGEKFFVPLVAHPNFTRTEYVTVGGEEITEDIGYLLGALVGDGCMNKIEGDRQVGFSNLDEECLNRVRKAAGSIGAELNQPPSCRRCEYTFRKARRLKNLIIALNLNHLSYFKRIPDAIIESPKPVLAAFIQGLFDTDGTAEKTGQLSLCTTSEQLSLDVQRVLQAFGIVAVRRPKKSASGRPTWNLFVMGVHAERFSDLIGFGIKRKQERILSRPSYRAAHSNGLPPSAKILGRASVELWLDSNPKPREWHARNRSRVQFCNTPSIEKLREVQTLTGFEADALGVSSNWTAIETIEECVSELMDLCVPFGENFIADGIPNHNTWGILHKIVKHCWEFENAHALIIVGVRRQATAGGSWHKLLTDVLPMWKQNLEGFDHSDQKQNTEKDLFVWVRNKHGGWSMIQLISIPHGQSLAARIRGIEASIIFVDELVGIGGPEYFDALIQQLGRRPGIPTEDQQYLAATNPDGPSHWVYNRFHVLPLDKDTKKWDPKYAWYRVPISENPSPQAKAYYDNVLEATRNDPVEYDRMVLGKWVDRPSGEAIFAKDFDFNLHVQGDLNSGQVLTPRIGLPITVGYDLGDSNHGIVFMQERYTTEKTIWIVFDEIVYTDLNMSFEDLVPELIETMNFWCDWAQHSFTFNHVSDKSAFDRFRAQTGSYDHRQIEQISRRLIKDRAEKFPWLKRPVHLEECPKPQGSVAGRIKLLRMLLQRQEIVFSAKCQKLIKAMQFLESEKDDAFKPRRSEHLHPYDALTYPLFYSAMGGSAVPTSGNQPQLIAVGS